ncbi:hypothetical protein VTN00DRAFT_4897 [Thermoascus crustaceus]|uniref:uncharacterized protein n=1 Tax=Thermoascus crustaceus TaxID=5088 RepID=UPI0037422B23
MFLTPPVSRDNFHYSNGDFYVASFNQNQHRRATIPELRALFHPPPGQPPTTKDPPAHWYKAQLLHYGLQPSDNKGTAAKRLLDALNQGRLEVPVHLQRLERELKKEWDSNERKARKELAAAEKAKKAKEGAVASKQKGKGTKRKAADDGEDIAAAIVAAGAAGLKGINVSNTVNINVNIGGRSSSKGASTSSAKKAKKEKENDSNNGKDAKKTTKRKSTAAAADNAPKTPARKPQTARCAQGAYSGVQSGPTTAAATSAATDDAPKPTAKKQTAKCSSRGGHSGAQSRSTSKAKTESKDSNWSMREELEGIRHQADDRCYWDCEDSYSCDSYSQDSYSHGTYSHHSDKDVEMEDAW